MPVWFEEQYLNAEKFVLGAILARKDVLPDVRKTVRAEMFYHTDYRDIFEVACDLYDEGTAVDIATVGGRFIEKRGNMDGSLLSELTYAAEAASDISAYCEIIVRESTRMDLIYSVRQRLNALESGEDPNKSAVDILSDMDTFCNGEKMRGGVGLSESFVSLMEDITDIQEGRKAPATPSGFSSLDKILGGGFQRNGLYIVAARPGKGKTAIALSIAKNVAKTGKRTLFISLEMDRTQIASRLASADIGGISPTTILNGTFDRSYWDKITECASRFDKLPITFNWQKGMSVKDIRYLAKSCRSEFVVIDYLGLIANENESGKIYEETTKKSKQLKSMARDLECPVLCLAQMNRESEKRGNKKPMLSDLRDSGSIEQDADAVIFNWVEDDTEDYELPEDATADPVDLKLVVAKNRHGRIGIVPMYWDKLSGKITELQKAGESGWTGRIPF